MACAKRPIKTLLKDSIMPHSFDSVCFSYDNWKCNEPCESELSYLVGEDVRAFEFAQVVRTIYGGEGMVVNSEWDDVNSCHRYEVRFSETMDESDDITEWYREAELRAV